MALLKTDVDDFLELAERDFITTPQMVLILIMIEIVVQGIALLVNPTVWWTWQLLGFIAATNLGAVILAVFAQRAADRIGEIYRRVFTPDFYGTVQMVSDFRTVVLAEAEKEGNTLDEEISEMGSEIYAVVKAYLETRKMHEETPTPELTVPYISKEESSYLHDDELFLNDA